MDIRNFFGGNNDSKEATPKFLTPKKIIKPEIIVEKTIEVVIVESQHDQPKEPKKTKSSAKGSPKKTDSASK